MSVEVIVWVAGVDGVKQKVKRVRGVTLKKLCLHGLPPDAKNGNIRIGKAPIAVTTKTQLWFLELEMSVNV
jgi:hypothetical protein